MHIDIIKAYQINTDIRGTFTGVVNFGQWAEINYLQTNAGYMRGNHYHKALREFIFILQGSVQVDFIDMKNSEKSKETFHLESGEGVEITPYVFHTLRYLTNTEQISLLDRSFDPDNPDLYTMDS